jgi:hypothetical protein
MKARSFGASEAQSTRASIAWRCDMDGAAATRPAIFGMGAEEPIAKPPTAPV